MQGIVLIPKKNIVLICPHTGNRTPGQKYDRSHNELLNQIKELSALGTAEKLEINVSLGARDISYFENLNIFGSFS